MTHGADLPRPLPRLPRLNGAPAHDFILRDTLQPALIRANRPISLPKLRGAFCATSNIYPIRTRSRWVASKLGYLGTVLPEPVNNHDLAPG